MNEDQEPELSAPVASKFFGTEERINPSRLIALPAGLYPTCCRVAALLAHLHTHSITSSARASKVGGIVRPRVLAVRAFRTSSSLSDC